MSPTNDVTIMRSRGCDLAFNRTSDSMFLNEGGQVHEAPAQHRPRAPVDRDRGPFQHLKRHTCRVDHVPESRRTLARWVEFSQ